MPTAGERDPGTPRRSTVRDVLHIRNYRLFVTSHVVASTGVWMQRIAQDWLVLSLTGSVTAVGINAALQFAPVVAFGLFGGVLADRYSKRMLLMITQSVAAALAVLLAVLTFSGAVQVHHVFAVSFALGLVTALDNPSRQVFVPELVGRGNLRTAVSVNSSVFQLGGLLGPAAAGVLIATLGEGWAFAINAAGCLTVVVILSRVRRDRLFTIPSVSRAPGQLRAGLRYVREMPVVFWTVVLAGSASLLSLNLPVVLAAFADDVYESGASGFGTYNALLAVGGILGAALATRQRPARLRNLVTLASALGVAMAAAALAPGPGVFGVLLVAVGAISLLLFISTNLVAQLSVDPAFTGRVMALYLTVVLGGRAVGGPVLGSTTQQLGAPVAMLVFGGSLVVVALVMGLVLARTGSLRISLRTRPAGRWRTPAITPREDGQPAGS